MSDKQRYIYVISDGEFVKIGFAANVESRLRTLQTSNARELEVIRVVEVPQWKKSTAKSVDAKNHEKLLHRELYLYHVRGEWFEMEAIDKFDRYWRSKSNIHAEDYREEAVAMELDRQMALDAAARL